LVGAGGGGPPGAPLAEADELHRNAQRTLDGDNDASLGGAVELRQNDAGHAGGLREDLGLLHTVLAGGRVEHQKDLGDRGLLGHNALDLAELIHQRGLVLKASRGIDENNVDVTLDTFAHGFESNRGRVCTLAVAAYDINTNSLAPRRQLIGSGRAECIGGTQNHGLVFRDEDARELAHGRRLAVRAGDRHGRQARGRRCVHVGAQRGDDGARVSHLAGEDGCAVLLFVFGQLGAEPVPVENIVAKHEGNGAITNKICTKNKCLSQPVRGGLHLVFEVNPES